MVESNPSRPSLPGLPSGPGTFDEGPTTLSPFSPRSPFFGARKNQVKNEKTSRIFSEPGFRLVTYCDVSNLQHWGFRVFSITARCSVFPVLRRCRIATWCSLGSTWTYWPTDFLRVVLRDLFVSKFAIRNRI